MALVLLWTDKSKLLLQCKGPCEVKDRRGDVKYTIYSQSGIKLSTLMFKKVRRKYRLTRRAVPPSSQHCVSWMKRLPSLFPNLGRLKGCMMWRWVIRYPDHKGAAPGSDGHTPHDCLLCSREIRMGGVPPLAYNRRPRVRRAVSTSFCCPRKRRKRRARNASAGNNRRILIDVQVTAPTCTKTGADNRFAIDVPRLNDALEADSEPMTRADSVFASVRGAYYFSEVGFVKGYLQNLLTEALKPKTAFSTTCGLYQFRYMPFGIKTAPAGFVKQWDGSQKTIPMYIITKTIS